MPSSSPHTTEHARPWLGTIVAIRASGPRAHVDGAVEAAFDAVAAVHREMSFQDPASALSRLNRDAATTPQPVGPDLWRVLRAALALARASDGRFDPTVGACLVRWRQLPAPAGAPPAEPADWRDLDLRPERCVRFRRPLWLDLGGIAKGYAVDRAIAVLRAAGMTAATVNAGGDLRCFGPEAQAVHVRDPADPGRARPLLALRDGAVATSAGYFSRQVVPGLGPRSALVDTATGRALGADCSASVFAPRAIWADALTKVVLADAAIAAPLLRRLHAQAVVLHADGRSCRLA